MRGLAESYTETFAPFHAPQKLRKYHATALYYYLAAKEFQVVNMHLQIVIDDEVSNTALEKYDQHVHDHVLPPAKP